MSPSLWESVAFGAIYWHEDWMDVDKILQIFAKKVEPPCGSGKLADYIPARASVDPDKFGMVIATEDGACDTIGDAQECLSIQSISKVFTFSPVLRKAGDERRKWVGREPCGIGLPGKNDVGGRRACDRAGRRGCRSLVAGAERGGRLDGRCYCLRSTGCRNSLVDFRLSWKRWTKIRLIASRLKKSMESMA